MTDTSLATSSQKYKRTYKLYYRYDDTNNKWLYITLPITLDFTIERNNLATANRCRLTLYNLSKQTRDLLFRDELDIGKPYNPDEVGWVQTSQAELDKAEKSPDKLRNWIELEMGYESTHMTYQVFSGAVLWAYSYKQGVDYITEINAYSTNLKDPLTYITYEAKAGKTYKSAIFDIATQLTGIYNISISDEIAEKVFTEDTVLMGTAEDILAKQLGYKSYVDNNSLYVFNDKTTITKGREPTIINSKNGLLASPRRTQNGVKISMVFEPQLRVGQLVQLNADLEQTYNGTTFIVSGFKHTGSVSTVRDTQTTSEVELIRGLPGFFRSPKDDSERTIIEPPKNVTIREATGVSND